MVKRLIHTTRVGSCSVKIYRDSEWNEFVVKTSGVRGDGYHTDDRGDARSTAAHEARWLKKQPRCRR